MPVEWPFAEDIIQLGGVGEHKIAPEDGARQQLTAHAILSDLANRPGVILADEVGMGKTYVALAVVASVVRATRGSGRPVLVMVPPASRTNGGANGSSSRHCAARSLMRSRGCGIDMSTLPRIFLGFWTTRVLNGPTSSG